MLMLKTRYSQQTGQLDCGVGQGDPLSMYLFISSIDPIIRELSQKYDVAAYADDVLLGISEEQDPDEVINIA